MKTLIYLPKSNQHRCFRTKDIERLCALLPVIITPEEERAALQAWLKRYGKETEILITGWGTPPLNEHDLNEMPNLKLIVHAAGTVKRLLPEPVWERGIRVASCNRALAVGVAETTLGMIIAGLKGLFYSRDWTRNGGWSDSNFGRPWASVRELFDLKVGIVSASQVGRHLLGLLAPFEVERYLYDPFLSEEGAAALGAKLVDLPELMAECDVVTIHAPALPETHHLISGPLIQLMKDNAILINTARGSIVEQEALVRELQTGRITAFLDVSDPEPPGQDDLLRSMPNVILTSHLSGAVTNGCQRQGRSAVEQVLAFVEGEPLIGEIRLEALATMA